MKADNSNYCGYNRKLQPFANKLRKEMTKAEACLWKYTLRARQMNGYQFRRQRPVLQYIADFMCKELKLVIEVDGLTHQSNETCEKDKRKTYALERARFKVLRFADEQVLNNMNGVREVILSVIEELEAPPPTPASGGQ